MGVDGTTHKILFLDIKDGEDVTITTPEGLEIFVMNAGGQLTFCNETNDYYNEGAASVAEATVEGTWIVEPCKKPEDVIKEELESDSSIHTA